MKGWIPTTSGRPQSLWSHESGYDPVLDAKKRDFRITQNRKSNSSNRWHSEVISDDIPPYFYLVPEVDGSNKSARRMAIEPLADLWMILKPWSVRLDTHRQIYGQVGKSDQFREKNHGLNSTSPIFHGCIPVSNSRIQISTGEITISTGEIPSPAWLATFSPCTARVALLGPCPVATVACAGVFVPSEWWWERRRPHRRCFLIFWCLVIQSFG